MSNLKFALVGGQPRNDALHYRQLPEAATHLGPRPTHAQSAIHFCHSGFIINFRSNLNNGQMIRSVSGYRTEVSNLVAIRHMWRQAQFLKFNIFGNFKDCDPHVQ